MNSLQIVKSGETVEVRNTVLSNVMLRTWSEVPAVGSDSFENIVSDVRLTADQARTLAANLLHAAFREDGLQVSFFYHDMDCTPVRQANDLCACDGNG